MGAGSNRPDWRNGCKVFKESRLQGITGAREQPARLEKQITRSSRNPRSPRDNRFDGSNRPDGSDWCHWPDWNTRHTRNNWSNRGTGVTGPTGATGATGLTGATGSSAISTGGGYFFLHQQAQLQQVPIFQLTRDPLYMELVYL